MVPTAIAVPLAAFISLPALTAFYAIKARLIARNVGERTFAFPQKALLQFHGILIVSPLLPLLALLREFDILTVIAISVLGVLCFMVAIRAVLFGSLAGIHEAGFVWHGTVILFSDVESFSVVDPFTLIVRAHSGRSHTIVSNDYVVMQAIRASLESFGKPLQ